MGFIKSAAAPLQPPEKAWFFIFLNQNILVCKVDGQTSIPCLTYAQALDSGLDDICYLGRYDNVDCYSAHAKDEMPGHQVASINFRALYGKIEQDVFWAAGYARQIHDWNMNFKFCGRCGANTQKESKEQARKCPECSLVSYPRISPAILAAVVKGDQILLARGVNFPNKKMFSVLAGFVDPGETLEACVAREVFEETGIRVKQIRYFGSQPWPFPDSLMIGFIAEYDSGDIVADLEEIAEADWFSADQLPIVPGKPSLSGELIEWFVHSQKKE